jgi:hypothetical protein
MDIEDQSLWKITKRVTRGPTPSPLCHCRGDWLSQIPEKAEALADRLEVHFQPVNILSQSVVIEMIYEAIRAYEDDPQVNRN